MRSISNKEDKCQVNDYDESHRKITRSNESIYLEDLTYFGRTRKDFSDKVNWSWNLKDESSSKVNPREMFQAECGKLIKS